MLSWFKQFKAFKPFKTPSFILPRVAREVEA
jgi:hypothetical protein